LASYVEPLVRPFNGDDSDTSDAMAPKWAVIGVSFSRLDVAHRMKDE
jgi:hypothetical protein